MHYRTRTSVFAFIVATLLSAGTVSAFAAGEKAEGKVLVFKTEFSAAAVFDNPQGCTALPTFAHIMVNQTNVPIKVFGSPSCAGPFVTAEPGWGGHTPPAGGSFSP